MNVVPEPSERCTTAIAWVGSLALGIELLDRRIIPGLDFAEVNLGERRAVEHELARLDAVEVDDRHDAAHHHRELDEAALFELGAGERRVGRAERHGLGLDLLDAAAGTDRLIVEADAGLLLIGVRPLGVDRVGECRAGAGDVGGGGGARRGDGNGAGRQQTRMGSRSSFICFLHPLAGSSAQASSPRPPKAGFWVGYFVAGLLRRY